MTILAGVLGDPIAHSRSPRLHGHWLAHHGIDGQYVPLRVRPGDLAATLDLLPRLGFAGVNVTIPLKEAAFAAAHEASARAALVGAANTLTFRDGRIVADTTDGAGLVAHLAQSAPDRPRARPAVVLGAGGAAAGIVAALLEDGAASVAIANRTGARAAALAARFDGRVRAVDWARRSDMLAGVGLVVNATSLGMTGQPPLELELGALPADAVVADIVYAPLETPLLAAARARGLVAVDGLGMLLHQAVPGFVAWFGTVPAVDDALREAVLA